MIPVETGKEAIETESVNMIGGMQPNLSSNSSNPDHWVKKLVDAFLEHVNLGQLLFGIFKYSVNSSHEFVICHFRSYLTTFNYLSSLITTGCFESVENYE